MKPRRYKRQTLREKQVKALAANHSRLTQEIIEKTRNANLIEGLTPTLASDTVPLP